MVETLLDILNESKANGTRFLVLKGNGKSMCSGFDFSGIESQSDSDLVLRFIRLEQLLQEVYHAPFHTLALIKGACYGAGADLAVSCSYKISTPNTKFRMPGLKFGVVLGTHRLAHMIGTNQARSILETCKVFNANEANECDFINEIVLEEEWDDMIKQRFEVATSLDIDISKIMLNRTRIADTRDSDLATLTRSVAVPGIQKRIVNFIRK